MGLKFSSNGNMCRQTGFHHNWIEAHPELQDECLVSTANQGWSNVYVPIGKGAYGGFGYNLIERRWSYGIAPRSASTIAAAVHQWLESK